jgi:protein associated with RNAse G/E
VDEPVKIRFSKWGDIPHWSFDMARLGEDEHGVWLWMPAGTAMQRGSEPPIVSRNLAVKVITPDQWWTAIFNDGATAKYELYVDIATPAQWEGDTVRMVDLDLDIARRRGGATEIHDEDEFEEHQVRYGYPDHIIDKARTETARLAVAVERRDEPFGEAGERWLVEAHGR